MEKNMSRKKGQTYSTQGHFASEIFRRPFVEYLTVRVNLFIANSLIYDLKA